MDLDPELGIPEHVLEAIFGARAFAFALRQWLVTANAHCLVWSDLHN